MQKPVRQFVTQKPKQRTGFVAEFSPDRRYIIIGGETLWLWELETGWKVQPFEPLDTHIYSVAFSPDQSRVISGTMETITLWECDTGRILFRFQDSAFSLAFTLDGKNFIYKDLFGQLHIRDRRSFAKLFSFDLQSYPVFLGQFQRVAVTANGKYALYGCKRDEACLLDIQTGECIRWFRNYSSSPLCTTFSTDERLAITGHWDGRIYIREVDTGFTAAILKGHKESVWSIAVSPNGQHLLSGSNSGEIRLWDLDTATASDVLSEHKDCVVALAFSPDSSKAYSYAHDGKVCLWDIQEGGK